MRKVQRPLRRCGGTPSTGTGRAAAASSTPQPQAPRDKPTPAKTTPAKFKGTAGMEHLPCRPRNLRIGHLRQVIGPH